MDGWMDGQIGASSVSIKPMYICDRVLASMNVKSTSRVIRYRNWQ